MRENSVKGIENAGPAVLGQSFGKGLWLGRDLMEALGCLEEPGRVAGGYASLVALRMPSPSL